MNYFGKIVSDLGQFFAHLRRISKDVTPMKGGSVWATAEKPFWMNGGNPRRMSFSAE